MKNIKQSWPKAEERFAYRLMKASVDGDVEKFKSLMSRGAQVMLVPSPEHLKMLNDEAQLVLPEKNDAFTLAVQHGRREIVDHIMQNVQMDDGLKEAVFRYSMQQHQLGIVKLLLEKYGIRYKDAIVEAVTHDYKCHYEDKDIALYLIEHDEGGFFNLYCNKERHWIGDEYDNIPSTSILKMALGEALYYHHGQGWHVVVDAIAKRHLELLYDAHGELEGYTPLMLCLDHLDLPTLRVLRTHLRYVDVNQIMLLHTWCKDTSMCTPLYKAAHHTRYKDEEEIKHIYEDIRFLITYGANIKALGYLPGSLTVREGIQLFIDDGRMKREGLEAYDRGEKEGLEIWRWNQSVMREVVKWSGCVMRGDLMGLGKHAVEVVVKFAPAQFEEKLELSTVRMLRAQMMLEMGHGVTFGDVHHGGYVKYAGTIGEGVTLHRWNATVTCDYHIDVKMKGVARIVQVSGDSYVDKAIEAKGVVSYVHVWGGDAYDQKLYAQQQWYVETGETLPTLAGTMHGNTQLRDNVQCDQQNAESIQPYRNTIQYIQPQIGIQQHVSQITLPHTPHQLPHIDHNNNELHTYLPHHLDFLSSFHL